MARHFRRLTLWLLGGVAVLVLLALLALAALWWFFDPDDYRAQIESRASIAIGRPVHLSGRLRWQLGRRISIASEGGSIANAPGFDTEPLARWSRIRLGIAARPLFHKRVVIDHIDVEGLQLRLQRNAQGVGNWELRGGDTPRESAAQPVAVRIAGVALRGGTLRFQDAGTGADWHVTALAASARMPEELDAPDREFRDVDVAGRIAGGRLTREGVPFALQTPVLRLSTEFLRLPMFKARWAEARVAGGMEVRLAGPDIAAKLELEAPSLRALLASASLTPPPMRDAATLGALQVELALHYAPGTIALEGLSVRLDDTALTGHASFPQLRPFAVRFDLVADRVNLDRYREPADVKSEPLELPLAWLKQLDAKGTLLIHQATIAGAAAKDVRIDAE
jgi:AsmA protein